MSTKEVSSGKKRSPVLAALIGLVALLVLPGGGFTFGAIQENHDSFCASCHTEPESTFFQQSTSLQAIDLASFHTTKKTLCIDCHSGPGLLGRLQAELLGARNAFAWYTHTAVQPAKLNTSSHAPDCLNCHNSVEERGYLPKRAVTIPGVRRERGDEEEGGNNHWHELMSRWQAADPKAGSCMSCHPGHSTTGNDQTGFQDAQTNNVCNACHAVLRRGDRDRSDFDRGNSLMDTDQDSGGSGDDE